MLVTAEESGLEVASAILTCLFFLNLVHKHLFSTYAKFGDSCTMKQTYMNMINGLIEQKSTKKGIQKGVNPDLGNQRKLPGGGNT